MRYILLYLLVFLHAQSSIAFLGESKVLKYCRNQRWEKLVDRANKGNFNPRKYKRMLAIPACIQNAINSQNAEGLSAILKIADRRLSSEQIAQLLRRDQIEAVRLLSEREQIDIFYSLKLEYIFNIISKSKSASKWVELILKLIEINNDNSDKTRIEINGRLTSGKTFLGQILERGQFLAAQHLVEAGASLLESLTYGDYSFLIDIKTEDELELFGFIHRYLNQDQILEYINNTDSRRKFLLLNYLVKLSNIDDYYYKFLKQQYVTEALSSNFSFLSFMRPALTHLNAPQCLDICEIPSDENNPNDWIQLACGHTLCRSCLLRSSEIHTATPLSCFARECGYFLSPAEKQFFGIDPKNIGDEEEIILKETLSHIPGYMPCRQADCPGFSFEQHHYPGQATVHIKCVLCGTFQCIECGSFHPATMCPHNQLEADMKFIQNEVNAGKLVACPRCGTPSQKIDGCPHVICASCKTHYNWTPTPIIPTR